MPYKGSAASLPAIAPTEHDVRRFSSTRRSLARSCSTLMRSTEKNRSTSCTTPRSGNGTGTDLQHFIRGPASNRARSCVPPYKAGKSLVIADRQSCVFVSAVCQCLGDEQGRGVRRITSSTWRWTHTLRTTLDQTLAGTLGRHADAAAQRSSCSRAISAVPPAAVETLNAC